MRLIDADALTRKFADFVRESNNSDFADVPTWNDAVSFVRNAPTIEAELQRAYEQGVKDALDKYDETCRIASDIRMATGCKTAKECWELIRNGEIQRVKHGHWIFGDTKGHSWMKCSECCVSQSGQTATFTYCPNCGSRMDNIPTEKVDTSTENANRPTDEGKTCRDCADMRMCIMSAPDGRWKACKDFVPKKKDEVEE